MAKPFSIQSPEDVAKTYGGNKQKIAQAMQLGIVDPTAGVLAGMFIDKMRSAQMQEAMQKPTVAQQVMGGAPTAPTVPPPPAGGLGATPQAAPQAAPPMAPETPEGPGMADGGMAYAAPYTQGGGLSDVPIPDTMFDEPSNGGFGDGYAGGGIVAFAGGGPTYEDYARVTPMQESRGRYTAHNKQSGALGKYQLMPSTARALAERLGLGYDPAMLVSDTPEARQYQDALGQAAMKEAWDYGKGDPRMAAMYYHGGPSRKGWGKNTQGYANDILGRLNMDTEGATPERDVNTAGGRLASLEDIMGVMDRRFAKTEEEQAADEALRARVKEMGSPEYYEKQRKDSMWETLATIGFNMASSKSPYLLQAIGDAAAAAMPGAVADKKERKALKDKALDLMVDLGARDRKEALDKFKIATDVWQQGVSAEQFQQQMAQRESQFKAEYGLKAQELKIARDKLNAEIAAAKNKGFDVDSAVFQMFMSGDPAMKKAAEEYLGARYSRTNMNDYFDEGEGGGGPKRPPNPALKYQQ